MARIPDPLTMIARLIESPSISSTDTRLDMGNRAVADLLASWLEDLGFSVEIMPLSDRDDKANLVATLGADAREASDGLVLAGHTDTVPYDEGAWQHDPFRLTRAGGRLYGLGTADMKAFFALALTAAAQFKPRDLRAPLVVLATADEESTMGGARALARCGRHLGRYALIGEPTGLRPRHAHKGILIEAVAVHGRAGHASDPRLGANAIEGMHRVLSELLAWRDELQARHRDERFEYPLPTLNPGRIRGGDSPNRIPARCELSFDLRLLPGMDLEALRQDLRERVRRALDGTGLEVSFDALFEGVPTFATDTASPIVRAAEALTGHASTTLGLATEGPFLQRMGLETVILGPGEVAQAHQPDEYLAEERLAPTVELLKALIHRFCTAPAGG